MEEGIHTVILTQTGFSPTYREAPAL